MTNDFRARLQKTLGDAYTLERELGGGGMSRVFVAREQALQRDVVVKVVAPELAEGLSAERFAREVRLVARLQQANIVPVLATGDANGLPYYTMPFVRGESLRARLSLGEPATITDAVNILRDVARALAYAHHEGIIHRDIKPENILISGGAAVVTDFGIAKALTLSRTHEGPTGPGYSTLTQAGMSLGTPAYMAPEQALGDDVDARTDLYAWGVVAWELLVGTHPFAGRTTAQTMIAAHLSEAPRSPTQSRAAVPRALSELVLRCLEKDPARRPASAAEVLGVLDQVGTPTAEGGRDARPAGTRRMATIGVVAAVVVAVVLATLIMTRRSPSTAAPASAEKSLAVLPFESVGGDTANTYFAEGIADELTTALTKVPGLRLAATSSAFTYRNKTVDAREVGKALSVASVLQGRVRRDGLRMRVTAQLTNAADGRVLWSNSYEREVKGVFAVQDELTRDIVGALSVALASDAAPQPHDVRVGTSNTDAYDLYLRGVHFLNLRGPGVPRSIGYFQQALAKDSLFARAWAQLGTAYAVLPLFSLVPRDSVVRLSRAATETALRLDPASAEAHAALGMALLVDDRWADALSEIERAIAFDPTYTFSYRPHMTALCMMGRADDAITAGRRAVQLDPLAPSTFAVYSVTLLNGGRRSEALDAAHRGVELDSTNSIAEGALGIAEYFSGHTDLARVAARRPFRTPQTSMWVGFVRAATGGHEEAAAFVRDLERERGRNSFVESAMAWTYLGAGDTTRALDALDRAAKAREPIGVVGPFNHPAYDAIRQSAHFAAVIRAFGLDPRPYAASPAGGRQ